MTTVPSSRWVFICFTSHSSMAGSPFRTSSIMVVWTSAASPGPVSVMAVFGAIVQQHAPRNHGAPDKPDHLYIFKFPAWARMRGKIKPVGSTKSVGAEIVYSLFAIQIFQRPKYLGDSSNSVRS